LAYIGTIPAEAYTSFAVQHFTTSATDTFTLDFPVANENEIALFINNVRQEPGSGYAYTASGTTLTLASAITGSDSMYCVFIGKAVQTVTPAVGSVTNAMLAGSIANAKLANSSITLNGTPVSLGGSATTATTNGITEADIWRITADLTGDQTPISSGWERADTDSQNYIGTGMAESSGVFTFPSTGIYLVNFYASLINNSTVDALIALYISATTNGSSFGNSAVSYTSISSSTYYNNGTAALLFDVTNTSTHKVQFKAENIQASTTLEGNTGQNETYATFIRLGDT
jgi:hypothetical protein